MFSLALIATLTACVLWVDRRVALWFNAQFHGTAVARAMHGIFVSIEVLLPVAAALLLAATLAFRSMRPAAPRWLRRAVSGGSATALSLGLALALKFVFGRSDIDPMFLRHGIYRFAFFHLRPGYGAFPSAHMAGVTALVTGLRLRTIAERSALAFVIAVLAFALLVTNGHWLSDIIAGTCLGIVMGRALARRFGLSETP